MTNKYKTVSNILNESNSEDNNIDRSTEEQTCEKIDINGDGIIRKHYKKREIEDVINEVPEKKEMNKPEETTGTNKGKPSKKESIIQKLKP